MQFQKDFLNELFFLACFRSFYVLLYRTLYNNSELFVNGFFINNRLLGSDKLEQRQNNMIC